MLTAFPLPANGLLEYSQQPKPTIDRTTNKIRKAFEGNNLNLPPSMKIRKSFKDHAKELLDTVLTPSKWVPALQKFAKSVKKLPSKIMREIKRGENDVVGDLKSAGSI